MVRVTLRQRVRVGPGTVISERLKLYLIDVAERVRHVEAGCDPAKPLPIWRADGAWVE